MERRRRRRTPPLCTVLGRGMRCAPPAPPAWVHAAKGYILQVVARQKMPASDVVSDGVGFEVERFEWAAGDRLEVTGRWYGLRGHRFVRPVLVVQAGDEQRRMLALLEHKPWAADDGERVDRGLPLGGRAAGADRGRARRGAEPCGRPAHAAGPRPARQGAGGLRGAGAGPPGRRRSADPPGHAAAHDPAARQPAPHETLPAPTSWPRCAPQLAGEQATVRRLAAELEDARQGLAAAAQAADDHDALERERDAALAARDAALARANLDHDAIIEERDSAVHERSAALYERDEALDERAAANFERESAIAERDAAFAERDRAVEAHRAAVSDLEALEHRMAEAEQARVAEIARPAPAAGPVRALPGERRELRPDARAGVGPARGRADRARRLGDRRLQGPARHRLTPGAGGAGATRRRPAGARAGRGPRPRGRARRRRAGVVVEIDERALAQRADRGREASRQGAHPRPSGCPQVAQTSIRPDPSAAEGAGANNT